MSSARDIPGFYYDANRNRYFPVSSRDGRLHKKNQSNDENSGHFKDDCKPGPNIKENVVQLLSRRETGVDLTRGDSCMSRTFKREFLETQASKPQVWSYGTSFCSDSAVEEFYAQVQTNEGIKGASFVTWGNSKGFLGVCEVLQPCAKKHVDSKRPEQIYPELKVPLSTDFTDPPDLLWNSTLRVGSSKITAIKKLRDSYDGYNGNLIFTTLGSGCEGGAIHLLKPRHLYDGPLWSQVEQCVVTGSTVWTAAYCAPAKATIGTSRGAALVHLETSALKWLVHSKSDVLIQSCDLTGNLVFCGFRNGYISMVDIRCSSNRPKRMPLVLSGREAFRLSSSSSSSSQNNFSSKHSAQKNVHSRQKMVRGRDKAAEVAQSFSESFRMDSAVCSLVLLQSNEMYLLASAMNGNINLWDRRLVKKGPVLTYEGNRNSHSLLGLGLDANETLLSSGGEDRAVRIWSLRSGKLLKTIAGLPAVVDSFSSASQHEFSHVNHSWKLWLGSSAGLMYMHG